MGRAPHKKKNEVGKLKRNEVTYMIFETLTTTFLRANLSILDGKKMDDNMCMEAYNKIHRKYEEYSKQGKNDIYSFLKYMFPNDTNIENIYEALKVYCNSYSYYILEILSDKLNEPNDLGDLELLIYVNKNNKLFTKEKKWKKIIVDSGLEEYLFDEESI